MPSRERDQCVAIRGPQCCDHVDVVAPRAIKRIREGIGIGSDAIDLLRKLLDRLDETRIAAQLKQCPVKMKIAVEHGQQIAAVDRRAVVALDAIELVDIAARNGERQDANRHDFQFLADRVDLPVTSFRREVADDRAAIWDALNDALFLELEEREPDVGAMRVELLAKILLDQPLARVTPAEHDVFFQARRDDARRSPVAARGVSWQRLRSVVCRRVVFAGAGFCRSVLRWLYAERLSPIAWFSPPERRDNAKAGCLQS